MIKDHQWSVNYTLCAKSSLLPAFVHTARMYFYILKWLKKLNSIWWHVKLCKKQISVSINKVSVVHSHTHLFMYCLWLLLPYNGRVELCGPQNLKYLLSGFLWKKFVNSWIIRKAACIIAWIYKLNKCKQMFLRSAGQIFTIH